MADQPTVLEAPKPQAPASGRWPRVRDAFGRFRRARWTMAENRLFLLLAVIIGLFSGLLVVLFQISIEWFHLTLLGSALQPSRLRLLLVPALAGVVVAVLVIHVFPRVRGTGVNQTKAAVYISNGEIPFSTVIGKFFTCALAIGSGQSLGPEDPSLQIGAGVASALGRRLRLSRDKARLIAPVGAAAGLAAAFNAPISSVLFVIEEVIGRWSAGMLGAVVLAALSSAVVERGFMGNQPLFRIPAVQLVRPFELLAYAVLGVVGGFAALFFVKLIGWLRPYLQRLPRWTFYAQPAAAGLLIGVIGLWFPQVMGAGYEVIDQALHEQYTWEILGLLALFKIVATGVSFSSGTPGGMFAPTLFIGAMLGGAVGVVERHFFPGLTGSIASYALVGMGTLFAGFLRVPLTSVFMVLELSGNYSIILPVMVSNTIAYFICRRYQPQALFDLLSRQDGVDLPSMEEQREETPLRVEDAMHPPRGPILSGNDTVAGALEKVKNAPEPYLMVNQGSRGWSLVTKELLEWQLGEGKGDLAIVNLPNYTRLPWLHPDEPLYVALRRMGDWPVLPVVNRANPQKLEGTISLDEILATYRARSQAVS